MIHALNIGIAGQVASDGTATLKQDRIATSESAIVLATVQTAGTPNWTLSIAGRPVAFSPGPAVDLGPRLVAPNESVVVTLSGGRPGSPVVGQLHGYRSGDLSELIQAGGLLGANQVSVNSLAPIQLIDRFDSSLLALKQYTILPGMASAGIMLDVNEVVPGSPDPAHSVLPTTVTLRGLPSGDNYVSLFPAGTVPIRRQAYWGAVNPLDTGMALVTGGVLGNGCFIDVIMSPVPMVGQGGDQFGNLGVSMFGSAPAAWQAAGTMIGGTFAVAAGTDQILVGGVAGLGIFLFDLGITHNGNVAYQGSLWDGPSALGVQRGEIRMPAADTPPVHIVGSGAKAAATAGNSLIWRPDAEQVGTTTYFTIAYNRG